MASVEEHGWARLVPRATGLIAMMPVTAGFIALGAVVLVGRSLVDLLSTWARPSDGGEDRHGPTVPRRKVPPEALDAAGASPRAPTPLAPEAAVRPSGRESGAPPMT